LRANLFPTLATCQRTLCCQVPKQDGIDDCGVYTMRFMHHLVETRFADLGQIELEGDPKAWRRQYRRDLRKWSMYYNEYEQKLACLSDVTAPT
ncbi:hypothetical protein CLOP_g8873, partial [Closterium sp. NIES-67]